MTAGVEADADRIVSSRSNRIALGSRSVTLGAALQSLQSQSLRSVSNVYMPVKCASLQRNCTAYLPTIR